MIWSAIIGQVAEYWPWLLGLLALPAIYWRGKHNGKVDATREVMERYAKTRKQMDAVDTENDDPRLLREWLRERGK